MQFRSRLPYRNGVGLCLFNPEGLVFLGQCRKAPHAWQMPQGGIQKDETFERTVFREMPEEIGTDKARIVGRVPEILSYDFPDIQNGTGQGKYCGQKQVWFALLFTGADSDINLNSGHDPEGPEFKAWRWERLEKTPGLVIAPKRRVYERVVEAFGPLAAALRRGETLTSFQDRPSPRIGGGLGLDQPCF